MKGAAIQRLRWVGRKLRSHFIAGLFLIIPLGLTVMILAWVFNSIDGLLRPLLHEAFADSIPALDSPGVGFGVTLILIYLAGVIASNVLGRRLIRYGEAVLTRIPIARYLYIGIRQILQSFQRPDTTGFMQVVLVEFPRKGTRTLGFITNETSTDSGRHFLNVFIPTSPNPTSGFLQIIEEDQVIRTKLTVDEALKMIVSAGRMSPHGIGDSLSVEDEESFVSNP